MFVNTFYDLAVATVVSILPNFDGLNIIENRLNLLGRSHIGAHKVKINVSI